MSVYYKLSNCPKKYPAQKHMCRIFPVFMKKASFIVRYLLWICLTYNIDELGFRELSEKIYYINLANIGRLYYET